MFIEFYGLSEDPFQFASPRHLYLSVSHRKALASLHYGIEHGGRIQVLLADGGMGKTTLLRCVQGRLASYGPAVLLSALDCKEPDFLTGLLRDLKVQRASKDFGSRQSETNEIRTPESEMQQRSLLLVDDAHKLNDSALESVLSMAKLEAFKTNHFGIVLAARPELLEKLEQRKASDAFQQIWIAPLAPPETEGYIKHRLRSATGRVDALFTPAAYAIIAQQSEGIPQGINNICLTALMTGARRQLKQIDTFILGSDGSDNPIAVPPNEASSWRRITTFRTGLSLTLLCFTVAAGLWYQNSASSLQTPHVAVRDPTSSPTRSFGAIVPSSPLVRPGNSSKVAGSSRIQGRTSLLAGEWKGSSISNTGTFHPSILPASVANREMPRLVQDDHTSARRTSIPGAATATILIPKPFRRTADPKLNSSAGQSRVPHEQPAALTALRTSPTTLDTHRTQAQTDVGDGFMRLGQYRQAINVYENALDQSPDNAKLQQRIERARRAKATEEQVLAK